MGVILGQIGENSMSQTLSMLDDNFLGFFTNPISGVLCGLGLLTIFLSIYKRWAAFSRACGQ